MLPRGHEKETDDRPQGKSSRVRRAEQRDLLRLETDLPLFDATQIVDDLRVAGSGSDADASIPILFRPPNRVVEDFDPVCIPEFDPTVRTTDNDVVANDALGYVDEGFAGHIGRGLARVAKRDSAVAFHDQVPLHDLLAGADPNEDGGPPAAVAALDILEHVPAKGPVFQSHHVDGPDVVAT